MKPNWTRPSGWVPSLQPIAFLQLTLFSVCSNAAMSSWSSLWKRAENSKVSILQDYWSWSLVTCFSQDMPAWPVNQIKRMPLSVGYCHQDWVSERLLESSNLTGSTGFRLCYVELLYIDYVLSELCRKELSFSNTMHLHNPWNENKPVKIGRDGQVSLEINTFKKIET